MSKKKFALLKKIVSCAVIAGLLLSFPANAKAMEKISASDGTSVTLTDGNYFTFQNETAKAIKKAKPNASLTLHTDKWISFNKQVLSALKERSDVSLTIEYKKDGQIKSFTIPAGFDVMSLANNEGYAGFLYIEKNVLLAKSEAKAESQTPPDTKGVPFAEAMGMTFSNYFPMRWNNPPFIFISSYDHHRYDDEDIAYVSRSGLLELTALNKLPSERAGYKTYLIQTKGTIQATMRYPDHYNINGDLFTRYYSKSFALMDYYTGRILSANGSYELALPYKGRDVKLYVESLSEWQGLYPDGEGGFQLTNEDSYKIVREASSYSVSVEYPSGGGFAAGYITPALATKDYGTSLTRTMKISVPEDYDGLVMFTWKDTLSDEETYEDYLSNLAENAGGSAANTDYYFELDEGEAVTDYSFMRITD